MRDGHPGFNPISWLSNFMFSRLTAIYILLFGTEEEKKLVKAWLENEWGV